jgi:hypothetical protein
MRRRSDGFMAEIYLETDTVVMSETEQFVLSQIPGIQICYHRLSNGDHPDWPLTLKLLLSCHRDYTQDLKKELDPQTFNYVVKSIGLVVRDYITNGEMKGPYNFKVMSVNRNALHNRISAKVYQAYKDGIDISKGLKTLVQAYTSPYCMRLTPREERAICVLYRAAKMDQLTPTPPTFPGMLFLNWLIPSSVFVSERLMRFMKRLF